MVQRPQLIQKIARTLESFPVAALLGPRQCGKTTLARFYCRDLEHAYFDLEDPRDHASLGTPLSVLEKLSCLVVIDEIQKLPQLFEIIRVLVDKPGYKGKFLILGSASPRLVKGVSESLAGRVGFVEMSGFTLPETGAKEIEKLWIRGGFPRSFLAPTNEQSIQWRNNFIRTFLERDIPALGLSIPAPTLNRFWTMLAHYHGNIWKAAELARSLGRSENTVRRYLDLLTGTFVLRQLQPWYANIKKRQVKSPKIYIRDSGLLHALLAIPSAKALWGHPKYGASWEGFALEQVIRAVDPLESYFWATHAGAELDLLIFKNGKAYGFEFKCADAPRLTKSIRVALEDLSLEKVWIIYPGDKAYALDKRVEVVPLSQWGQTLHFT